jgi:hypothetical protein
VDVEDAPWSFEVDVPEADFNEIVAQQQLLLLQENARTRTTG